MHPEKFHFNQMWNGRFVAIIDFDRRNISKHDKF